MIDFVALVGNNRFITNYYIKDERDSAKRRILGMNGKYDVFDINRLKDVVEDSDYRIKYIINEKTVLTSSQCLEVPKEVGIDILRLNIECQIGKYNGESKGVLAWRIGTEKVQENEIYESCIKMLKMMGNELTETYSKIMGCTVKTLMNRGELVSEEINCLAIIKNMITMYSVDALGRCTYDVKNEWIKRQGRIGLNIEAGEVDWLSKFCIERGIVLSSMSVHEGYSIVEELLFDCDNEQKYLEAVGEFRE